MTPTPTTSGESKSACSVCGHIGPHNCIGKQTPRYKFPVCRGSKALGSACGKCERCKADPWPNPPDATSNPQASEEDITNILKMMDTECRFRSDAIGGGWAVVRHYIRTLQARNEELGDIVEGYEEAQQDKRRLTREIDVIINGEDGAAKQASLCDVVPQIARLVADAKKMGEAISVMAPLMPCDYCRKNNLKEKDGCNCWKARSCLSSLSPATRDLIDSPPSDGK